MMKTITIASRVLLVLSLLGLSITSVSAEDQVCASDGSCDGAEKEGQRYLNNEDSDSTGELPDEDYHDEYDDDGGGFMGEDRDFQGCVDVETTCAHWASIGECDKNPSYMLTGCAFSCGQCDPDVYLGVKQVLGKGTEKESQEVLDEARDYMIEVAADKKLRKTLYMCYNKHEECAFWGSIGECENNPTWMKAECGPVCKSCDQALVETRCPILKDGSMPDVWGAGDLNQFFTNLTTLPEYKQYEPMILSQPKEDEKESKPWVVTLEKFMSEEECDRLIELGYKEGYERSADVGEMRPDGTYGDNVNDGRTSENAWCQNDCLLDERSITVVDRIANVTGVPEPNSEFLQLLKYEVGQFYQTHHDYIDYQRDRPPGPRILTVFLYLNDVEEGGGTNFPDLDLTVEPKKGRALIWPSVIDKDPNEKEEWTEHQALPVIKGQKFGANAWLHLRDFKAPNLVNCH